MKESRLFGILYYLLDKERASARELAERFEVSVRTIYRDIDTLSSAGIPIYTETGRSGGVRLMSGFVLDKAALSEEERQDVLFAVQVLLAIRKRDKSSTVEKLSALFKNSSRNWVEVDLTRWGDKAKDNEKFELLKDAVIHNRCIEIDYISAYNEVQTGRKVLPLKLLYKSKDWYLQAYCTEKKDFRTFKLSRILRLNVLEERFSPVEYPDRSEVDRKEYSHIRLRFSKDMAYRVYDEFAIDQIETDSEGNLTVTTQMPEDAWLVGFLLSFGTKVEILEPPYLKGIVASVAKDIYEMNKP
ncbi:MAG TPA: YafY family protein [Bacillota bacterium]|nr:YafY family protein [Bacillota bacterium]